MLPFAPDWRWMLGRGDTPWYPTMRLFRQAARQDWAPVVAAVRTVLQEFAEARRAANGRKRMPGDAGA